MAEYMMALSINPDAKKTHPDLNRQVNASLEILKSHGIIVERVFATLGRFDFLALFQTDDQNSVFLAASAINKAGVLDTETWPVIPYEDFSDIIEKEI